MSDSNRSLLSRRQIREAAALGSNQGPVTPHLGPPCQSQRVSKSWCAAVQDHLLVWMTNGWSMVHGPFVTWVCIHFLISTPEIHVNPSQHKPSGKHGKLTTEFCFTCFFLVPCRHSLQQHIWSLWPVDQAICPHYHLSPKMLSFFFLSPQNTRDIQYTCLNGILGYTAQDDRGGNMHHSLSYKCLNNQAIICTTKPMARTRGVSPKAPNHSYILLPQTGSRHALSCPLEVTVPREDQDGYCHPLHKQRRHQEKMGWGCHWERNRLFIDSKLDSRAVVRKLCRHQFF